MAARNKLPHVRCPACGRSLEGLWAKGPDLALSVDKERAPCAKCGVPFYTVARKPLPWPVYTGAFALECHVPGPRYSRGLSLD